MAKDTVLGFTAKNFGTVTARILDTCGRRAVLRADENAHILRFPTSFADNVPRVRFLQDFVFGVLGRLPSAHRLRGHGGT